MQKVDHYVLWIKHFPEMDRERLRSTEAGEILRIYINGHLTRWERMRPGGGRPTEGFKIVLGREMWETIPMRAKFVVSTSDPAGESKKAKTLAPATLPPLAGGGGRSNKA
jgi:hypothetical protein